MLVRTKKRKHQKEVLSLKSMFIFKQISNSPEDRRIVESDGRSGKRNNEKCCFKHQSEAINISPNLNKSSQSEVLFRFSNKIISEDSLKISEDHRLRHFDELTRKLAFETTSKIRGSFEAKKRPKLFTCSFSENNNLQCHLYTTRYLQTHRSSPLMETIAKDIPASNSFGNSRKRLDSIQNDDVSRRNPQSYSLQQNGCGIYNEIKSGPRVGDKNLDYENLCLERCRKSSPQAASLPETTRE